MILNVDHRTEWPCSQAHDDSDTKRNIDHHKPSPLILDVEQLNVDDAIIVPSTSNKRKPTDEQQFVLEEASIPNGGYGWIVVLASFMCNLTVDGICYTFGIFLPHFLEYFDSNEAITALTGSLLSGCYMTVGVFVSSLVNRFGCRPVTIAGSIMASLSFALSTRAPNVYILLLTYGIITGSSFGFIYLPSIVSVGHYFTTKRAFATGIAVCGSGMGAFLFSPFCQWLLTRFHWKQALLVLSSCIASCSFYGLLMKPLITSIHEQDSKNDQKRSSTYKSNSTANLSQRRSRSSLSVNRSSLSVSSRHSNHSRRSVHRPRTWTITSQLTEVEAVESRLELKNVLDFSVLKIPAMALLALSNVFGMVAYYIPYVYIIRFATEQLDIQGNKAAWLLSAVGISNVIGRLAFGLISDRFSGTHLLRSVSNLRISALFINNICLLLSGFSVMVIPFCQSYCLLLINSIIFGFTISSYMSLTSIILVDLLSLELLTTTFGLISCVRGLSSIIGPPLAGLLYEMTYSYTSVFIASGSLLCLASAVSFIVHRYEQFD